MAPPAVPPTPCRPWGLRGKGLTSSAVVSALGVLTLGVSALGFLTSGLLTWGTAPSTSAAYGAPPSVTAKLRSKDEAVRLEGLATLLDEPRADLTGRARALREPLRRLVNKDPVALVRGLAAQVLARADGERALPTLVDRLDRERDPAAARLLPRAFAEAPTEPARRALGKVAFDPSDPRRAALAAESLGALTGGAGLDDLLALVDGGKHWAVTAGACLGLATQRDPRVPPRLLRRLRDADAAVRAAARDGLVRLCGVDHGVDPTEWESWWKRVEVGYAFPATGPSHPVEAGDGGGIAGGPSPRDPTTSDRHGARDRPTHARFFGIPVRGRRVAFVIDFSQSMWGKRRDRAQKELSDAVKGLSADCRFSVVLFNEKVWWFRDGPLPARPQEKLDLVRYLPEQETKSYTNIYDALELALGLTGEGAAARDPAPGLDELILLSDGVPNRGKLKRVGQILLAVEAMNGGRVTLHTVSLGNEPSDLLRKLAEQNGGRHVEHPFPK